MRKTVLVLTTLLLAGLVSGADAVISPSSPGDILLNSSNSYSVDKKFDGSASTPDSVSYSWQWVENSVSGTGPTETFKFDRQDAQTNTIKLTVSGGGDSANDTVTQTLRDKPNISISINDSNSDVDLNSVEGFIKFDSSVTNSFDDPVSYDWTINGSTQDTSSSFVYNFDQTGDASITLNVSDDEGYFTTASDTVTVTNSSSSSSSNDSTSSSSSSSSSSSGSGGGGGGGGTGSNNPYTGQETFAVGNINSGSSQSALFFDSPITKTSIKVNEDVSGVEISSTATKDKPDAAGKAPENEVYRYVELEKTNLSDDQISSVDFSFQIQKSWLEENDIIEDSVTLERYSDGQWEKLETEKTNERNNLVFYEASSSGFSVFAVTGEKAEASFKVTSLEVSPENPGPGDTVDIKVKVQNSGEKSGDYTVSFELAGESFEKTLQDVGTGESASAEFSKKLSENGTYTVEVGEMSSDIKVGSGETGGNDLSATSSEEDNTGDSGNASSSDRGLGLIVMVPVAVLGVLLALGAGFYVETDEEQRQELVDRATNMLTGESESQDFEDDFEWEGFDSDPDLRED